MKVYIVIYDNNRQYEDYESYAMGIFDDYIKAVQFCLSKGYEETGTKDLFKKKDVEWFSHYEYLTINEIEMNKELDCNGEVVE
jgi:hypothetical protein